MLFRSDSLYDDVRLVGKKSDATYNGFSGLLDMLYSKFWAVFAPESDKFTASSANTQVDV